MKEAFEKIDNLLWHKQMQALSRFNELNDLPFNLRNCYDESDLEEAIAQSFEEAQTIVSEVEAEYGNGWIDVKDRLPEKDGYYLTCDHKGNIHVFFHSQEFKETAPFGICEHHSRYYQPIAWMELPKPYNRLERK